jgi:hypothetical protein
MKKSLPFILIALAIATFVFFTDAQYGEVQELEKQKEENLTMLGLAQELRAKRKVLEDAYDEISAEDRRELEKLLPDTVDNVRLILAIDDVASQYGIGIRGIGVFAADSEPQGGGLVTTTTNTNNRDIETSAENSRLSSQIISALNQIESLRLDPAIFNDPIYRSLQDRSRPLVEESVGKSNPFDPINSIGAPFGQTGEDGQNTQGGNNNNNNNNNEPTGPRGPSTITNTRSNQQGI